MIKFKFYFIALLSAMILFSCRKDDDTPAVEVLRDYGTQYATDIALIEKFLSENYIVNEGLTDDQRITIDTIEQGNPNNRISLLDDPKLHYRTVDVHGITYKLYYIDLRNGDPSKEAPTRVDKILVGYEGSYLKSDANLQRFDLNQFPSQYIELDKVITGWIEIFPYFKPGNINIVEGQPPIFSDYGAGMVFIPSGLGYYNVAQTVIPSYVPLIFTFKLYDMKRADQDGDGIMSVDEDLNHDGYFSNDDTDGDYIQNYLDVDDDNDAYQTKTETLIPGSSPAAYYPYNPTPDQPMGVPSCSGDFVTPERVRKYLDRNCH